MAKFKYHGNRISAHQTETPEGYLICHDVPISRTGTYEYSGEELLEQMPDWDLDPKKTYQVHRLPEDVFDKESIASLEGKPIVQEGEHPSEDVNSSNIDHYHGGHLHNVHPEVKDHPELLLADFILMNPNVISAVKNKERRQPSIGYDLDYEMKDGKIFQRNIRGNHVAIVPDGRAGNRVSIRDSAPVGVAAADDSTSTIPKRRSAYMAKTMYGKILSLLHGAHAADADMAKLADEAVETIDAAVAEKVKDAAKDCDTGDSEKEKDKDASTSMDAATIAKALDAALKPVIDRISALEAGKSKDEVADDVDQAYDALKKADPDAAEEGQEEAAEGEDAADPDASEEVEEEASEGEGTSSDARDAKKSRDAALKNFEEWKPIFKSITDPVVRKKAMDAKIKELGLDNLAAGKSTDGKSTMTRIVGTVAKRVKSRDNAPIDFNKQQREAQEYYDALREGRTPKEVK